MMRFFAAVLLGLFVAGCSKVVPEQQGGSVPVTVRPSVNVVSEVRSSGVNSLIEDAAGLQGYPISLLGKFTINSAPSVVFGNTPLVYNDSWSYGNKPQYWVPGALYNFAAFCPYAAPYGSSVSGKILSNGTVSYDNAACSLKITEYSTGKSNTFDARAEDLLYASVTRNNTLSDDYSPVSLQMNHLLACLEFSVRNATENDIESVDNISLEGVKYKCTINIDCMNLEVSQNTVDKSTADIFSGAIRRPETGQTSFLPKGMSSTSYKHLFDCMYLTVLPQDVYGIDQDETDGNDENIYLNFTVHYEEGVSDDVTYKVNLSNIDSVMEWEMGRKYSYNLTITSQNIYFQVVEVPWIEHEVEL